MNREKAEIRKKLDEMIRYQKPEERDQQLFEQYIEEFLKELWFHRLLLGDIIKKMEEFCKCYIYVDQINCNSVKVVIVCLAHKNVAKWKVDFAVKCIDDVLYIPDDGVDFVMEMQLKELAIRNATYKNCL
ncbi:hypothetical protein T4B_13532 [Trichinella pseudospiralis]|uniref:Uncharacterized protein n=1 Tax=Trichinella pseudospiralis TaxID=6337 RepID=A0A0V1JIT8_TRIPS|nr:hypothetical protein T4B_13532 [Trichinella pseudospiralis]KRZ34847.1 hypothetical protein T4C_3804 [Trichinella pseudospiralis]